MFYEPRANQVCCLFLCLAGRPADMYTLGTHGRFFSGCRDCHLFCRLHERTDDSLCYEI